MRKALEAFFRFLAKAISVVSAILFVLITSLVLLLFNAERSLLNAGTYKHALAENEIYQQLPSLTQDNMDAIKAFLSDQAGIASEDLDFMNNLTDQDWQTLLTRLLPPDETRGTVENMLDQVFAFINGETDTASLSLVALKAHFNGQAGKDLTQYLLSLQPPCTDEQMAEIHSENIGLTGQLVFCNPSQPDLAFLASQWQALLVYTTSGIPDEIAILQPASEPSGTDLPANNRLASLNTARMLIRFSPLLPLILLILITLCVIRTLRGWLLWWGIPLFITGLIVTAIGLAIPSVLGWVWVNFLLPQLPVPLSAGITGLTRDLVNSVAQVLARPITLEAASLGLIGLVAIIGSFFAKTKLEEPLPPAS